MQQSDASSTLKTQLTQSKNQWVKLSGMPSIYAYGTATCGNVSKRRWAQNIPLYNRLFPDVCHICATTKCGCPPTCVGCALLHVWAYVQIPLWHGLSLPIVYSNIFYPIGIFIGWLCVSGLAVFFCTLSSVAFPLSYRKKEPLRFLIISFHFFSFMPDLIYSWRRSCCPRNVVLVHCIVQGDNFQ